MIFAYVAISDSIKTFEPRIRLQERPMDEPIRNTRAATSRGADQRQDRRDVLRMDRAD
jgi:hypothetical protein